MNISLYLDENAMDEDLVRALTLKGFHILTTKEAGREGRSDEEQLEFAAQQRRVLYSFNVKDFALLHYQFLAKGLLHAGIILCQQERYSVGEQMRRIAKLAESLSAEQMQGRLEYLGAWGGQED